MTLLNRISVRFQDFQGAILQLWLALLSRLLRKIVTIQFIRPPQQNDHPTCYVLKQGSFTEALLLQFCCQQQDWPLPTLSKEVARTIAAERRCDYILYLDRRGFQQLRLRQPGNTVSTEADPSALHDNISANIHAGTNAIIRDTLCNFENGPNLVTVSFFWGRAPKRSHSLRQLLFSESWKRPSRLSKVLRVLLHGHECYVCFGEPITARNAVARKQLASQMNTKVSTPNTAPSSALAGQKPPSKAPGKNHPQELTVTQRNQLCRRLFRLCRLQFRQERSAIIGPDLSHRRQITHTVISSPQVREAIAQTAHEGKEKYATAKQQAHRYATEIASDYAHPFVRAYHLVLSRVWHRLYEGLCVHNIEQVQSIAGSHTLIYVPCHRSHMDYLLLPYLLYNAGLAPPHTAAGINLNLPIIGRLLRHGGAFFLRRQFKGNTLYTTVFQSYLAIMLARGFSLAFFIEGGRSRSGRLLPPKLGMVKMVLNTYDEHMMPKGSKPIAFIPVYIGYEKLFEGNTYTKELSGLKKEPESLTGVLKALRGLRNRFGRVHIQFGQPIYPSPSSQPPTPEAIEHLGRTISKGINAATVIGDINLISLALLAAPRHALDEQVLIKQLTLYQHLIATNPLNTWVITDSSAKKMIEQAIALGLVRRQHLLQGDVLLAEPNKALLLTYFRNNCLHSFMVPSLIACQLNAQPEITLEQLLCMMQIITPMLSEELGWPITAETLAATTQATLNQFKQQRLIETHTPAATPNRYRRPPLEQSNALMLKLLGEIVRPCLERYLVAMAYLRQQTSPLPDKATLIERLQHYIQGLAVLAEFNAPEFFDKKLIETLITASEQLGWLHWQTNGAVTLTPPGEQAYDHLKRIVGASLIPLLNL